MQVDMGQRTMPRIHQGDYRHGADRPGPYSAFAGEGLPRPENQTDRQVASPRMPGSNAKADHEQVATNLPGVFRRGMMRRGRWSSGPSPEGRGEAREWTGISWAKLPGSDPSRPSGLTGCPPHLGSASPLPGRHMFTWTRLALAAPWNGRSIPRQASDTRSAWAAERRLGTLRFRIRKRLSKRQPPGKAPEYRARIRTFLRAASASGEPGRTKTGNDSSTSHLPAFERERNALHVGREGSCKLAREGTWALGCSFIRELNRRRSGSPLLVMVGR